MNLRSSLALVFTSILLLAGCGGGTGGPGGGGGGGGGHPFNGSFVAFGTGFMHTMDLTNNGDWIQKISTPTSYAVPYVDRSTNDLYVATLNAESPMFITTYSLSTFGQTNRITWPQTEELWRVEQFAVAPGGRYMAARITGIGPDFLEILDAENDAILLTLNNFELESNILWTSDMRLVLAIEDPDSLPEGVHGAIIAIPLAEIMDAGEQLDGEILMAFDEARWGPWGPGYLALAPDDSKLAYELDGDIWVKTIGDDSAAVQLTTGPTGNDGPTFSPDGNYVAFVGGRYLSGADTMIVPAEADAPYFVDLDSPGGTEAYVLNTRSLVDGILAWLP